MLAAADPIYGKVMVDGKDEVGADFFGDDNKRCIREVHWKIGIFLHQLAAAF